MTDSASKSEHRSILIAGGGIAGLATALALARHGISSRVLERRPVFAEAGAGIQIGPNGTRVLDLLGVGELLLPHAAVPTAIEVMDGRGDGRLLAELPLGDWIAARHGSPYWVVRREDLHAALQARVAGEPLITLTMGAAVVEVEIADGQVEVASTTGQSWSGEALVGADGAWSTVRGRCRPRSAAADGKIGGSNNAADRGRARALSPSGYRGMDAAGRACGPLSRLRGEAIATVVIAPDTAGSTDWAQPAPAQWVSTRAHLFPSAVRELLAVASQWHLAPLIECPAVPGFSRGPIALVGDAAHPILPFLAQGGVMALEDAVVLARAVSATPDIAAAFKVYSHIRRARARRVAAASRRNGSIYHLSGMAAAARNTTLRALPGASIMARYDWLYGARLRLS